MHLHLGMLIMSMACLLGKLRFRDLIPLHEQLWFTVNTKTCILLYMEKTPRFISDLYFLLAFLFVLALGCLKRQS